MVEIDKRNGSGFKYDDAVDAPSSSLYFPAVVEELIDITVVDGGCLVEAGPRTGKSHLLTDLQNRYTSQGVPSLTLNAMINGGTKRGVESALYVLDEFSERHAADGVILVDNADYYGYSASGRTGFRSYSVAQAHIRVAEYLRELVVDTSTPSVLAAAHNEQWRQVHWRYPHRRDDDEVTPAAQALLESFLQVYPFTGSIDAETARGLVPDTFTDAEFEEFVAFLKEEAGEIYFRHLNHFNPEIPISPEAIHDEVRRIDTETSRLLGQTMLV